MAHLAGSPVSFLILGASGALAASLLYFFMGKWKPDAFRPGRQRQAVILILLPAFVLGAAEGFCAEHRDTRLLQETGHTETRDTYVLRVDRRDESTCRVILKEVKTGERILLTLRECPDPAAIIRLTGRKIRVRGSLRRPDGADNPGGFDYALYLKSQNIYVTMDAPVSAVQRYGTELRGRYRLENRMALARITFEQHFYRLMGEREAGLLCGILFGDGGWMDGELADDFRRAGIGHLLAVSGLHVGMVYGVLHILFRRPRTLSGNLPIFSCLLLYACLSGFSPSAVRAVFMIGVLIVSRVTYRRYDLLSCAAFCSSVILLIRPMMLFSSGFQLSFLAVLSMAVLLPKGQGLLDRIQKKRENAFGLLRDALWTGLYRLTGSLLVMLALQLGMTPLSVRSFHYASPAGLFLNLPAIALSGILVPLGMLLIPLSFLPGKAAILSGLAGRTEEMLAAGLIRMEAFAETSFPAKYLASPPDWMILLYYILLFFCCSEYGTRFLKHLTPRRAVTVPLLAVWILSAGADLSVSWPVRLSQLVFVDVGQGDCVHLKDGRTDVLFDSGGSTQRDVGEQVLIPYFLGNGVSEIDLAVISHLHTDHYAGLQTMTKGVRVRKLLLSEVYRSMAPEIAAETGIPEEDILFSDAGKVYRAGKITLRVLAPEPRSPEANAKILENLEDENQACLVVQAEYRGRTLLLTGDIDSAYEQELVQKWGSTLRSDILKVAHHGSKNSSCNEFLECVRPEVSVIQAGRNNIYGHPTKEAMDRIRQAGSRLYRNDTQGAVMLRIGRADRRISGFTMR